jgi:magnesium and cobalt exporter, CNNM family
MVELVAILILVLLNGIFAGAEIAILTLRKSRLRQLLEIGSRRARLVDELRNQPEQFFATVQIGITVVGAAAAALGGAASGTALREAFQAAGIPYGAAEALALTVVVVVISYLSIVIGELVPKSLALRHAEGYALGVAPVLWSLAWLMSPAIRALTASSNLMLRPFGDRTTFVEGRLSSEELQELVEEAARTGSLDEHTGEIASRAIDFGALTAGEIMVPRNRIEGIPRGASPQDVKRLLLETGHSRMPVYEGELDNIVGYVTVKDVLALAWEGQLIVLEDLVRPALFLPESMRATGLLQEMQRRRSAIAFVVDEHGGLSGLVTLRDLIEEVLGRFAVEEDELAEELIRVEGDGRALVRGHAPIRDVNRELDLGLPESERYSTVAGLCLDLAGGIPQRGARLVVDDVTSIEIVDASPHVVRLVRIVRAAG